MRPPGELILERRLIVGGRPCNIPAELSISSDAFSSPGALCVAPAQRPPLAQFSMEPHRCPRVPDVGPSVWISAEPVEAMVSR